MCGDPNQEATIGAAAAPAVTRRSLLVASGLTMGLAAFGLGALTQPSAAVAAGTYLRPCGNVPISDSWQGHKNRNPPSGEPGTDYSVGKGTPVLAATDGMIVDRKDTTSTATGRYLALRASDGNYIRYLHLNSSTVGVGATVTRGQVIAYSGASGFGSDNGYGAHVHVSLWIGGTPNQLGYPNTVDFENYIGDSSQPPGGVVGGVKEIAVHGSGWSAIPVGQSMSNVFSAVNMGSGWGDIYGSFGGRMQLVGVSGGAWTRMDSGLALNATSLSALNVGQGFPHVLAVENGVLQHISANSAGWQKQSTGVSVPGKISGVVLPGNNVQAVANVGGVMHHITSHSGWEIGNSSIPIGSEFKAVNVGGQLQIVTVLNGIIHLIWPGAGWQLQSTGLPASGSLTAVDMGGGYPTIIANEGWNIVVTSVSNGGWVRQAMGVVTSGNIDAVNLGGSYPTIYAV